MAVATASEVAEAIGDSPDYSNTSMPKISRVRSNRHIAKPLSAALLQQASLLLACGRPQDGLQTAQQGLAYAPFDADLCNIAAVCAAMQDAHDQAEIFWLRALAIDPGNAQVHCNLALSHEVRGQSATAERYYRKAIACDPAMVVAYVALGELLATRGDDIEAEQCYRQTIGLDPDNVDTHVNLGALLAKHKRYDEAEQCYRQAIALSPTHALAHCNLGLLLAERKFYTQAEQHYRTAIDLDPNNAAAYTNLGLMLEACSRDAEAEQCHRKAIALGPNYAEVHSNLANLLVRHDRKDEAEQCYRHAIAINPAAPIAYSNLGVLLAGCAREDEAEQCFRHALMLDDGYARARLNLAFLLLRQGRFAEGWPLHEARYDPRLSDPDYTAPDFPFPQWRGEELAGKSILVWTEQGFGDAIQFCRYLPLLKQCGAVHVALACREPLVPLMRTLGGADDVFTTDPAAIARSYDCWALIMSLPLHDTTTSNTIPASIPYLHADPERISRWAASLPDQGFRVGLAWRGNPQHANDADRSLADLSVLMPLWSVPGVCFVSLQRDADTQAHLPEALPLVQPGPAIGDFADMAAIIAQLDLVICVDTAVAHLAGALGKPCWVLLPAHQTDWRWMHPRNDSPWYPNVMRLFRQNIRHDWTSVVAQITQELHEVTRDLTLGDFRE